MGVTVINLEKYSRLLAKTRPMVIESDQEFERAVEQLETLDFLKRPLTPEEEALRKLLARLIEDYDSDLSLPSVEPHRAVRILMEQRGLRQADMVPVLGARAQVSDLVNGKRGISKAQAKKLAEFFRVSVELFI